MKRKYWVATEELYRECPKDALFPLDEEPEILPNGIIGQERAVRAMELGLHIKQQGYNIFMSGMPGVGKKSYAQTAVNRYARQGTVPDDWLYVFNFENPEKPKTLRLPPGVGCEFCRDMEQLVLALREEISKALGGEEYERQKAEIVKEYQNIRNKYFDELNKFAEESGFVFKKTGTGFVSIPVVEGKQLNQDEYENLDHELKGELEEKSRQVQMKALEIMPRIQNLEKDLKEKIKNLEQETALFAIGHLIGSIKDKYRKYDGIEKYLEEVKEDVLKNLDDFRDDEEDVTASFPWLKKAGRDDVFNKYAVNLFVNNKETAGAPVVIENNPTYYNLIGRVEYENKMGILTTDFSMIKSGALHRANGGYLILQVEDLLRNVYAWDALKRVLKTREVKTENLGENYGLVTMSTLRPAPIPVGVKVILIGSPYYFRLLSSYDEDFAKLFKVKVEFDYEMDWNRENLRKMYNFVTSIAQRDNLHTFNKESIARVMEYSSSLAGDQEKLTTRFNDLLEILYEADAWARVSGQEEIGVSHIDKAIREKVYRSNRLEERIQEEIRRGNLLLKLEGKEIGQINGLSVLDTGDYSFGRPSRITAATFLGRQGIVNIERESRLSGRFHDKGVFIINGFLGARYAKKWPLSLSISITFEQSYGGVDGDSASAAELFAIISSLAEVPLDQGLAVTGSVNQKGEIQPIGGVNHKIEGFFAACKIQGLTGTQGVIIPAANKKNLMLKEEVRRSVQAGTFRIYAINTVDEGLEILTGKRAGKLSAGGEYPKGSLNYLVQAKVREYAECAGRYKKENGDEEGKNKENGA